MLPTQKLYQTVDRTQYDAVKQRHVSGLSPKYSEWQDRAKWSFLMGEFTRLFPAEQQTVFAFHQARLNTGASAMNISLRDCLNYFEQFYFLYTTTNPLFQLNHAEKCGLKTQVLDGMGFACEPGKQARFDLALVLYRRDTHWINGHLSQARYHVLETLAESCNVVRNIGNALSPHTIKFMKSLAEEKRLGIDREVALTDAYASSINKAGITTYFATHYSAAYREFEANAADDLAQQLLNELTDFLTGKAISMVQWDQRGLVIPEEHHAELFRFFESKSFNAILDDLRDDSDEEQLKLKRKADFITGLQSLVRKRLLKDEYYVALSAPNERPAAADVPSFPAWHAGVSMHDVLAFMRALQSESVDFFTLFNQYEAVLLQYPQMVLRFIATKPSILSALPGACRINGLFIDKVIMAVNAELLVAIEAADDAKIKQLIGCLLTFLPTSHDDFSKFDNTVLNHDFVAQALVKRCGLLLKKMSPLQKSNPLIVRAAMKQNAFALCFASDTLQRDDGLIHSGLAKLTVSFGAFEPVEAAHLIPSQAPIAETVSFFKRCKDQLSLFTRSGAIAPVEEAHLTPYQARIAAIFTRCQNQLPLFARAEFNVDVISAFGNHDLIHARLKAIQKMKALHVLCSASFVGALKLATLAQNLTPSELVRVIQHREAQGLSALPYCDHLELFCQNLIDGDCNWLVGGYEAAKQRAQAVLDPPEMSAVGYLARTNHWYMALVQHHRAHQLGFKTMMQFLQQLQKIIKVTLESVWLLLKFTAVLLFVFSICFISGFFAGIFMIALATAVIPMVLAEAEFFGIASIALLQLLHFIHVLAALGIIGAICEMISPIVQPVFRYIGLHLDLMFDEIDRIFSVSFYVNQILHDFGEWTPVQESMQTVGTQVYSLMKGIYATVFSPEAPPLPTDTLAARCERSIERLMFTKEDASANQKGALLSTLWDNVQEEGPWASEDVLKARLNKKYEMIYQGSERGVSFFEVASAKRASSDRFQLDEPSSVFGFFSKACATTTDSMLYGFVS